jgi:hypothetical protein
MATKPVGLGIIHKILIVFVAINIIGDIGNVAFWWVNPASRGSLTSGALSFALGSRNALNIGSIVLLVVAVIYIIALFGLLKKRNWAHQLIITITVVNRALALVLYQISPAFLFWAVWSIILIVVSYFDWRKTNASTPPTQ